MNWWRITPLHTITNVASKIISLPPGKPPNPDVILEPAAVLGFAPQCVLLGASHAVPGFPGATSCRV